MSGIARLWIPGGPLAAIERGTGGNFTALKCHRAHRFSR
ncbi:hypothetical protein ABIA06_006854 [Bradyrhizobium yuanmingense]